DPSDGVCKEHDVLRSVVRVSVHVSRRGEEVDHPLAVALGVGWKRTIDINRDDLVFFEAVPLRGVDPRDLHVLFGGGIEIPRERSLAGGDLVVARRTLGGRLAGSAVVVPRG